MRTFILIVLLFSAFGMSTVYGQGWEKTFGNDVYTSSHKAYSTPNGNYLIEGIHYSAQSNGLKTFLRMMNPSGELMWEKLDLPTLKGVPENVFPDDSFIFRNSKTFAISGVNYSKHQLTKYDNFGNEVWIHTLNETSTENTVIYYFILQPDGSSIYFHTEDDNFYSITKLNADGNIVSTNVSEIPFEDYSIRAVNQELVFSKVEKENDFNTLTVYRCDFIGNILSTRVYEDFYEGRLGYSHVLLDTGNWIFFKDNRSNDPQLDLIKIDTQSGSVEIVVIRSVMEPISVFQTAFLLDDGIAVQSLYDNVPTIIKTNFEGDVLWTKSYDHHTIRPFSHQTLKTNDNGFLIAGEYESVGLAFVWKIDSLGIIYPNFITGKIAIDTTLNCMIDPDENPLENWIITSEKDNVTLISTSDQAGLYSLPADTGQYIVTLQNPSDYWSPCVNDVPVNFTNSDTSTFIDFPVEIVLECPLMQVSQAVPSLRPCFERPSYVNYCNLGTISADSAFIDITYDSLITPVSSTISWNNLGQNVYRFNLGNLAPAECGSFQVGLFLDCNASIETTYCIEAHAYPDTLCSPIQPGWSGAFLEVSGTCEGDSVYFRLENTGDGNMDNFAHYIIVEDVILRIIDSTRLESGDIDNIHIASNGSAYTIISDQVPEAPGFTTPTAHIEGCGVNGNGSFSVGFSNQFPNNDANPFLDIDCIVPVNSFDPNDKQGFPIGYGDEHFIYPLTPIEYMIRFQNTGTDTAFTVIIKDTLDAQFDISTFRPGASSHEYSYDINGQGELVFNFQNILLPDSNVNQLGSNGFVEFRIVPKADLALGSVLKNNAAIFFDFNDPIITNETFHTLGQDFIEIMVGTIDHPVLNNIEVLVHPNPFKDWATITIKNHAAKNYSFELFDMSGKKIRQENHVSSSFTFRKGALSPGLYFYRITAVDGFFNTGKIMLH